MYRLLNNGVHLDVSLLKNELVNDSLQNKKLIFQKEQDNIFGYIGKQKIGQLLDTKQRAAVEYLLNNHYQYYAWVSDIHQQIVAVEVVRPNEIVITLPQITICKKATSLFDETHYQADVTLPLDLHKGAVYIAKNPKNDYFYLFSKEMKNEPNKVLVLKWENDQLIVENEEKFRYRLETNKRLLANAILFDTELIFYETSAGQQGDLLSAGFLSCFEHSQAYLDEWHTYLMFEKQLLEDKVERCGKLAYEHFEVKQGQIAFHLASGQRTQIAIWQQEKENMQVETSSGKERILLGDLQSVTETKAYIEYNKDDIAQAVSISKKGMLAVSKTMGDIVTKRRENALHKTLNNLSIIPNLKMILSEPEKVSPTIVDQYTFPMVGIEKLVNGFSADLKQSRAIKTALNTNDIVLVQGPPGTGKTSVIQTIIKCLIENNKRNILISSYQHLAVDNAFDGLTEEGIIAHRFGGETYQIQMLENYRDIVQKITAPLKLDRALNEELKYEDSIRMLDQYLALIEPYITTNTITPAQVYTLKASIDRMQKDTELPTELFLASLDVFYALPLEQVDNSVEVDQTFIKLYDALPKTREAFKSIKEVEMWKTFIHQIRNLLEPAQLTHCEQLIADIKKLRRRLTIVKSDPEKEQSFDTYLQQLCEYSERVLQGVPAEKHKEFDIEPLQEALKQLAVQLKVLKDQMCKETLNEEQQILKQYIEQLDADPLSLANLIGQYAEVKAATCQQTLAYRHGMYNEIFDAVIIDEAARANPLDLLIPMTLGKKIILVGDHKQLPHILEPSFEREQDIAVEIFEDIYKKSLFERLYQKLPSTKKVMLEKQFRMHPVIGELVSRLFYESKLVHGMAAAQLQHDTGLYNNQQVAWLDVVELGEQGHYYNEQEATVLVEEIRTLLRNTPNYSGKIGIITFYNEQLNVIERKLRSAGLEKLVQYGTVDAFQGKECDIIFLSTVRSNHYQKESRALGFLRSPNRLNVALSRARKLLVVVGDSKTVCKNILFKQAFEYIKECGFIGYRH